MTEKGFIQFQPEEEDEQIDLKAMLLKYLRYWYLFAISVALALGLAFLYLRYTTPQYIIKSKILIRDDEKGADLLGGSALSDLDIFKSTKNVDNEIEVLNAVSLMQRVLAELSLNTSYYKPGRVHDVELYGRDLPLKVIVGRLDSTAYDKEIILHIKDNNSFVLEEENAAGETITSSHRFGQEIQKPYGAFTVVAAAGAGSPESQQDIIVKFIDIQKLAGYYNEEPLKIEPVSKDASVLWISLKEPVREKGKDIVNKLVEVYNKEAIEDKNLMASNTIQFIDERLKFLTEELSEVEKDVEEYKQENELTDVSSEAQLYVESASEYNKQLAELEIQLDVLNSIEKYLRVKGQQYQLVPSSLSIQDPTLLGLITKFNELQLERERMLQTIQPTSLLVQNVDDQLANLRVNILENLQNIKRGLVITQNNLKARMATFDTRIQQVPSVERELLEIQRQQGIKQGLYLYLLQKREEAAVSLAAAVSNSRVLDPAMVGDKPVEPKKIIVLLLALLAGLAIPFACIYVRDLLNDKVQEKKDVEQATATPVLGELAHNKSGESLVVTPGNRSPIVEMFRLVRTNLQYATVGKANKVVLVTSSMSGEGKTFFSINLGASLVLTGKKVVVLGFDLRKPRLLQELGLPDGPGITNYLVSDRVAVDDIVQPLQALPGLYISSSGPVPPNPAELMMSPKVGQLLEALKERFDYVIIDTAPVGQVTDAFTLAPYIDSSIYIVRYGYTFKSQLEIVDDVYKHKKLRHPMIVLNDAKKENSYGNGYGYGYGYGYGEDQKKNRGKSRRAVDA
ncbi:polysaccharide biosynthesis tyrosine autokinase [Pontibacter sp. 172403-2]|uniref:GumC family protein n=1 Tax=Pontibacter rufus TaxID=2791028 RepID=UPI0018AF642E|nr:tyrosine-protein kinase [Pontibacter sp. 172403-2]MBF9253259.1 polysaccharide biosynthesis tyrosine autokinase [Pontibacter sp. 172403-2]